MKQVFQKTVTSLLLLALVLTACKKTHIKTKTELLTQTTWRFDKATALGTDISSQIPSCIKDNIITFVSNGTGTISEGIDITRFVSFNVTIVKLPDPPGNKGADKLSIVSLVWKLHVKLPEVGGTQIAMPSLIVPVPQIPVTVEITFKH